MARIRTIKPELPQSESMGKVSRDARLLFILTWTLADDEGRLRGSSRMLASLLFPYDDDAPNLIDGWIAELVEEGCLLVYSVDGATYIQIAKWLNHQKIDKPSQSKIPPFSESSRILANPPRRIKDQGSRIKEGIEGIDQGKDRDQFAPTKVVAAKKNVESENAETWQAYKDAYLYRYGTEPVRNASVNAKLAQFVGRLGRDEAPHVARFYVGHNNGYYVREMHSVGPMLKDAEKLRTEWATNSRMTQTKALQADKTATNLDAFAPLIAAAKAKEEEERKSHAN